MCLTILWNWRLKINIGTCFFLEVSFWNQQKEHRFFQKTVLGIFKIVLRLRDQQGFMGQSVEILNDLSNRFFGKREHFSKTGIPIFSWKHLNWIVIISIENCHNSYYHNCQSRCYDKQNNEYKRGLKNVVLPVTALLFSKFCFSLITSYKELIWCTNDPDVYIPPLGKRWTFIWRCFFPVSNLKRGI